MEILIMIGNRAGEICDVRANCAHRLIERGEAIDPNAPIAAFHSGGIVTAGSPILVGENPSDHVIPRTLAERIEATAVSANRTKKASR